MSVYAWLAFAVSYSSMIAVSANPLVSHATNYAQGFETFVEFGLAKDEVGRNDWTPASTVNRIFLDWLAANAAHRFLGYLHYMEPHHPYAPAPAHAPPPPPGVVRREVLDGQMTEAHAATLAAKGLPLREPEVRYLRALYDGEISTGSSNHTLNIGLRLSW